MPTVQSPTARYFDFRTWYRNFHPRVYGNLARISVPICTMIYTMRSSVPSSMTRYFDFRTWYRNFYPRGQGIRALPHWRYLRAQYGECRVSSLSSATWCLIIMQFTGCQQPVQRSHSPCRKCNWLAGIMVIRCVMRLMRRAWTHKFQSSGP